MKCKVNTISFGFINTNDEAVQLMKDKDYSVKEDYDEQSGLVFYRVYDKDNMLTTISESEYKLFFK